MKGYCGFTYFCGYIQSFIRFSYRIFLPIIIIGFAALHILSRPAYADVLVGTTAGKLTVTASGAARYIIPITVPVGTAAVQPQIKLNYSSQAKNGYLGMRWSLGGVDAITRCGTNDYFDAPSNGGVGIDPVDYDGNDKFCLGGQRLVNINGTYGSDATEYRTAFESFSKIISHGNTSGSPTSFTVYKKNGDVVTYGATTDSRVIGQNHNQIRSWVLSRITDAKGNYINFTYHNDRAQGEFYITRIDYTGNDAENLTPYNHIEFVYETRPDLVKGFVAGDMVQITKRLTNVKAYAEGVLFRDYRLAYDLSATGHSRITSITQCASETSCFKPTNFTWSSGGQSAFDYVSQSSSILGASWSGRAISAVGDFNGDGRSDFYIFPSDQYGRSNGDSSDYVWLGNADGTFTSVSLGVNSGITGSPWSGYKISATGDFNGDGRTDIYLMKVDDHGHSTGEANDYVWLANSDGTFNEVSLGASSGISGAAMQDYQVRAKGDFNGDGLTDIYVMKVDDYGRSTGDANDYVWLATGSGTFTTVALGTTSGITGATWQDYSIKASGDFNRDGLTDLYLMKVDTHGRSTGDVNDHVWLAKPNGTFEIISLGSNSGIVNTTMAGHNVEAIGDFNGDGLIDLYLMKVDTYGRSTGDVNDVVWLAKGDGTFSQISLGASSGIFDSTWAGWRVKAVGDFNGDGRTDIYLMNTDIFGRSSGVASDYIWQANVDATFTNISLGASSGITHSGWAGYNILAVADFNGDGLTDIYLMPTDIYSRATGATVDHTWPSVGAHSDHLAEITDSHGRNSKVIYKNLSDNSVYTQTTGATYPVRDERPLGIVVSEVKTDNGVGGQNSKTYTYEGARKHLKGFGGLGFAKITATDVETGAITESIYSQDWANHHQGLLLSQKVIAPGGVVLSEKTVSWQRRWIQDQQGNNVACFRYSDSSTTVTRDLNGAFKSRVIQNMTYDDYGYPLTIDTTTQNETASESYSKVTTNTYNHDLVNWRLGLIVQASIAHKAPGQNDKIRSSAFTYDTAGLLQSETIEPGDPLFHTKTYGRNAFGAITSVTESWGSTASDGLTPTSRVTSYAYDAKSRYRTSETNPLNHTETTSYHPTLGVPASRTGPNGLTTSWTYDAFGRVTLETRADNSTTTTTREFCEGAVACPANAVVKTQTQISGGKNTVIYTDKLNREIRQETLVDSGTTTQSTENTTQTLVIEEDYETTATGWSNNTITDGGAPFSKFLGLHANTNGTQYLSKTFQLPNNATQVTLEFDFYEIDGWGNIYNTGGFPTYAPWHIEYHDFQVFVNDQEVARDKFIWDINWYGENKDDIQTHSSSILSSAEHGFMAYGADEAHRFSITVPVTGNTIKIGFGAFYRTTYGTMQSPINSKWGIDNLKITVPNMTVTQTVTVAGNRWSIVDTTYDALGRVAQKSEPYFSGDTVHWTSAQYDILGRATLTTKPDSSTQSANYNGLTVTTTNGLGQIKTSVHDVLGRVISVTDNASQTISYSYDPLGQMLSMNNGTVTNSYAYDIRGNKISDTDPDKGTWTYRYNALGLVVEQTNAKGQLTTITYDALGRMLTRIDDATAPNPSLRTATWVYDTATNGLGKLHSVTNPNYSATNSYDTLGRPTSMSETVDGTSFSSSVTYDIYSRVETQTYPSGVATKNIYDDNGDLKLVQNNAGTINYWERQEVDARGNITKFKLGNGVETVRSYQPENGFLMGISSGKDAVTVQNLQYSFNAIGTLTQRIDARQNYTENFQYDALNRVVQVETILSGSPPSTSTVMVSYDARGNIVSKSDIGTYSYGQVHAGCASGVAGPHAVTSVSGTKNATYCYDANGNMTSGDNRTITYSAFDKPVMITKAGNSVSFVYGPDRSRVKRVDQTSSGTVTTLYAMGKSYEKITMATETREKHYIGNFAVVTAVTTSSSSIVTNNYLHHDHLGSVVAITDDAAVVVQRMSFDAWGKRREVNWQPMSEAALLAYDSALTKDGFTGHEMVDPVGLIHMNGRVYDPELGRFQSADPIMPDITNLQSFNRYAYTDNNPLSYTDPDGHIPASTIPLSTIYVETSFNYGFHSLGQSGFDNFGTGAWFWSGSFVRGGTFYGSSSIFTSGGIFDICLGCTIINPDTLLGTFNHSAGVLGSDQAGVGAQGPTGGPSGYNNQITHSGITTTSSFNVSQGANTAASNSDAYGNMNGGSLFTGFAKSIGNTLYDAFFYNTSGPSVTGLCMGGVLCGPGPLFEPTGSTEGYGFLAGNLSLFAAGVFVPGARSLGKYDVGSYNMLQKNSKVGDNLDLHHVAQKHPARQIISGYDSNRAPSIALPTGEHRRIPTIKGQYTGSARDLLAKDIRDLRNFTNAPNNSLQDLIMLNKRNFPGAFKK